MQSESFTVEPDWKAARVATKAFSQLESIFFAFPDGVLHYECASCTALCCKGMGFAGSMKRDMPRLLEIYPSLSAMVQDRSGDLMRMVTPAGGCTLLRDDNRCSVEMDLGKAQKPLACILFPFNLFYRVGNTLVVAPHFNCMLTVQTPAEPDRVEGSYKKIDAMLHETGVLDPEILGSWTVDLKSPDGESVESVLARETRFRDVCAEALGKRKFRDVLLAASVDARSLRAFRRRIAQLMSWQHARPAERDSLDDILLTIAPSLRLMNLQGSENHQLQFLAATAIFARNAFQDTQTEPTLQSVSDMIHKFTRILGMLSFGEASLKVVGKRTMPDMGAPRLAMAAMAAVSGIERKGVLNALESAFEKVTFPPDRMAILRELSLLRWKSAPLPQPG